MIGRGNGSGKHGYRAVPVLAGIASRLLVPHLKVAARAIYRPA